MRTGHSPLLEMLTRWFPGFLIILSFSCAQAQTRVTIKQADVWERVTRNGKPVDKLEGSVVFVQNQTTIYCDSAYLVKDQNTVEAFGHVRITEGDSITVTGKNLIYEGNNKLAKLRDNVVFKKLNTATLYTDHLDYDRPKNLAYYFQGGRLVDSLNVLTSQKGYYDVNSNMASFKRNVHVKNPDYVMDSDSLQYNSKTKIIYFRTKTTVVNKNQETFTYEGGQYDTKTKKSILGGGIGETPSYTLKGEQYKLDDLRKLYLIRKNVVMVHKEENLTIYGQAVDYDKQQETATVFDQPWLAKVTDDNDTLFLRADTLVSIDSPDPQKKRLLAYHNVRIYKKDMQGVADSMVYKSADSMMFFYKDPVLWNLGNQMTADSITMVIKNNTIDRILMKKNAFVISEDTLLNFNQIKGRDMTAQFRVGKLSRVIVEGNGESLYNALDDEENTFIGVNKIKCSNIIIDFKDGQVHELSFYIKPNAKFIPPQELTPEDKKLKDFVWKGDLRPTRKDLIPDNKTPHKAQKDSQTKM